LRAAVEQFVRANSSDGAWDATDAATRERLLGNGATLFHYELHKFLSYEAAADRLRSINMPVILLHSKSGLPFAPAVELWLQDVLKVQSGVLSGHHAPYLDTPELFAEELRPILRRLWS
jgi:pimeloyl-ACP methyl ester carboxylesterase